MILTSGESIKNRFEVQALEDDKKSDGSFKTEISYDGNLLNAEVNVKSEVLQKKSFSQSYVKVEEMDKEDGNNREPEV